MNTKTMYRVGAGIAFVVSFITYLICVQPTVPFWDCGEFSGASVWQQVPHPPGAPLFLLLVKFLEILIPSGDLGWQANMISVIASAFTILLLYFITAKALENMIGHKAKTTYEAISVYGSALVAALAFNFSDTFWFNGVESEVYATSVFFVALITYVMMVWNEKADEPGSERYLLLIALLMGLSASVHLLAILTFFSIVLVVYFRKYPFSWKSFILAGIIGIVLFFVIYPGIINWFPAFLAGHSPSKNEAMEYSVENSMLLTLIPILLVIGAAYGIYWAKKNSKDMFGIACASFLLILLGYSTYAQILIRSNANPPMNENEPKNLKRLTTYLSREQYGTAPTWPRRYQTEDYFIRNYNKQDEKGNYVYGRWVPPSKKEVQRKNGETILVNDFKEINTAGELSYMWKYQINHMYLRYFLWNFVGRSSDIQDAGVAYFDNKESDMLNYNNGYKDIFPIKFYMLPLLFGLLGLIYHFTRDKKMAFAFLIMFIVMGVLTALQQNQQDPQPRERDYFYVGSFLVFAMWIGFGVYYFIDLLKKYTPKMIVPIGVVIASLILVPVNMAYGGWKMHDRSGNYFPFDYSYNILQSVEKDAIVFTNGDNDTFPVWFLQDVEGVRRDVRIVNLSLGNTLWYIYQLKNREPWGAKKVPISIPDDSLQVDDEMAAGAFSYEFGEARNVEIPVSKEILAKFTNDTNIINSGKMAFTYLGQQYRQMENRTIYIYRVQDKLIFDILKTNKFERPLYFSATVGPDVYIGLDDYLVRGGLALRITPVKQPKGRTNDVDLDIMDKCLMNYDNTSNFHKEPHYGFKFRNLNNPNVFYDDVHRRSILGYRLLFITYAQALISDKNDLKKADLVLKTMDKLISVKQFPPDWDVAGQISALYTQVGNEEKAKEYAKISLDVAEKAVKYNQIMQEMQFYEIMGRYKGPYSSMAEMAAKLGDYTKAREKLTELQMQATSLMNSLQENPSYAQYVNMIKQNLFNLQYQLLQYQLTEIEKKSGKEARDKFLKERIQQLQNSNNQDSILLARQMEFMLGSQSQEDTTKK
jgi:hypothetical protein